MGYYTRVLSKDEAFPPFDELAQLVRTEHPDFKLSIEEGTEEEWETLLLSSNDEVEVALIERNPVADGSMGQDEVAEFMEETQECMPETGVAWLHDYLASVKTVYAFQHSMPCAQLCGAAEMQSFKPMVKASPTRRASTLSGSFPTPSPAHGKWASSRATHGTISKWTWATPNTAKPS